MVSVAYYRAEAERCRKLADDSRDSEAAQRWRALARDYGALADDLAASPIPAPPVMHVPMQQQPVQQQQQKKAEPEDKS
jgi:hypothetical protein